MDCCKQQQKGDGLLLYSHVLFLAFVACASQFVACSALRALVVVHLCHRRKMSARQCRARKLKWWAHFLRVPRFSCYSNSHRNDAVAALLLISQRTQRPIHFALLRQQQRLQLNIPASLKHGLHLMKTVMVCSHLHALDAEVPCERFHLRYCTSKDILLANVL